MSLPISEQNLNGFLSLPDARSQILTAIQTELGTYTYQTQTLPAIWIIQNIDTDPPQHYNRTGLECLIFPPEGNAHPLHHNAIAYELWRIRLIQHDRSKSTLAAYRALLASFPDCTRTSLFPADRDIYEQLNLLITQAQIIN